jgi:hypothetical protein
MDPALHPFMLPISRAAARADSKSSRGCVGPLGGADAPARPAVRQRLEEADQIACGSRVGGGLGSQCSGAVPVHKAVGAAAGETYGDRLLIGPGSSTSSGKCDRSISAMGRQAGAGYNCPMPLRGKSRMPPGNGAGNGCSRNTTAGVMPNPGRRAITAWMPPWSRRRCAEPCWPPASSNRPAATASAIPSGSTTLACGQVVALTSWR